MLIVLLHLWVYHYRAGRETNRQTYKFKLHKTCKFPRKSCKEKAHKKIFTQNLTRKNDDWGPLSYSSFSPPRLSGNLSAICRISTAYIKQQIHFIAIFTANSDELEPGSQNKPHRPADTETTWLCSTSSIRRCLTHPAVHSRWQSVSCCSRSSAEQSSITCHCCPLSLHLLLSS